MKILIVAATAAEIQPTLDLLPSLPQSKRVFPLITGVGGALTAYHLGRFFALHPDVTLAINAGIAGTFRQDWQLGSLVQVVSDVQADLGVELANGEFSPIFGDTPMLMPDNLIGSFLPVARGLSVNRVHGSADSIAKIRLRFPFADVETMEGAAFFHAALQQLEAMPDFRFLALRAISNYVEPRNRDAWKVKEAIDSLNVVLSNILQTLLSD
jgi:futalosine hydrolase